MGTTWGIALPRRVTAASWLIAVELWRARLPPSLRLPARREPRPPSQGSAGASPSISRLGGSLALHLKARREPRPPQFNCNQPRERREAGPIGRSSAGVVEVGAALAVAWMPEPMGTPRAISKLDRRP